LTSTTHISHQEDAANNNHLQPHDEPNVDSHDETLFENPQFQHYEETSNIQLFFDLFFVANLTSFTNAHEVNSANSKFLVQGRILMHRPTWLTPPQS
jgi:low temperature requirement protein LtrA